MISPSAPGHPGSGINEIGIAAELGNGDARVFEAGLGNGQITLCLRNRVLLRDLTEAIDQLRAFVEDHLGQCLRGLRIKGDNFQRDQTIVRRIDHRHHPVPIRHDVFQIGLRSEGKIRVDLMGWRIHGAQIDTRIRRSTICCDWIY